MYIYIIYLFIIMYKVLFFITMSRESLKYLYIYLDPQSFFFVRFFVYTLKYRSLSLSHALRFTRTEVPCGSVYMFAGIVIFLFLVIVSKRFHNRFVVLHNYSVCRSRPVEPFLLFTARSPVLIFVCRPVYN